MTKRKGFSLIELVVVIGIISILAAIAIPNYVTYSRRASLQKTWSYVYGILDILKLEYARNGNAFPRSIKVGSTVLTMMTGFNHTNPVNVSTIPNVTQIAYSAALDYQGAALLVVFDPALTWIVGTPGYTDFTFGIRNINNTWQVACGGNDQYDAGIDRTYWPKSCNCRMVGYAWYDTRFMTDGNCY